jgi:protein-S-isoprenylcysteine O-methyltransferase Ste14
MRPTFCIIVLAKQSDLPQQRHRNASTAITFQSVVPRRSRPPVQSGEALAFSSWPALIIVLSGIVPTFAWRAHAEAALLGETLGESYALYRKQTKMIIPHLI